MQKLAAQHFVGGLFVADNFNAAHDDFVAGQGGEDNAHIAGGVVYVGVKIHARQGITQILQVFAEGGRRRRCSFAAVNVAFALRGEIGKGLFRRFAAVLQNIFGHRVRNALADMNDDFYAFFVVAEPRFFFRHLKFEIAVFQIQSADAFNVGVKARVGIAVVVGKEVEQAARFHFHQAAQRPVAENFVAFNVNIGHRDFRAFVHLKQNADAVAGQGRDDGVDFGVVEVAGGVDFLYAVCGFGEFAAVKDARARDARFFKYLQHSFGVEFFQAGKCYFGDDRIFAHANHEHAAVAQYFHGFEMPGLVKFAQQRRGGVGRKRIADINLQAAEDNARVKASQSFNAHIVNDKRIGHRLAALRAGGKRHRQSEDERKHAAAHQPHNFTKSLTMTYSISVNSSAPPTFPITDTVAGDRGFLRAA